MSTRAPWLVLGIGNELFTDEGLGVAAARLVAGRQPPDTEIVDGGTLGLGLVPAIEDREGVIVIDAAAAENIMPGTMIEAHDAEGPQGGVNPISAHQLGLTDALAATRLAGRAPRRLALLLMIPERLDTGYGLTPLMTQRIEVLADRAVEILAQWRAAALAASKGTVDAHA